MGKFSIVAIAAVLVGLASANPAVAQGMGDPSYNTRHNQEICDLQRRGEYPTYHNACPDYYPDYTVRH